MPNSPRSHCKVPTSLLFKLDHFQYWGGMDQLLDRVTVLLRVITLVYIQIYIQIGHFDWNALQVFL